MPLQTKIATPLARLNPGHIATTQQQFRYQLQAHANELWDQGVNVVAAYGTLVAWDAATERWLKPTTALKDALKGVVMADVFSDKTGYGQNELLNLEVIGDRILVCVTGITIKAHDPVHLVVAGANAGLVTNVVGAAGNDTVRLNGFFLEPKIATDKWAAAVFDLKPNAPAVALNT